MHTNKIIIYGLIVMVMMVVIYGAQFLDEDSEDEGTLLAARNDLMAEQLQEIFDTRG